MNNEPPQQLRVQYKGGSMSGVVREQKDGQTLVYWGAADRREFTAWVDDDELEPYPHEVYGEIEGPNSNPVRVVLYDPTISQWQPTK